SNVLMFLAGPFAGTRVPCSGRTSVVTKSPLTGIWAESDVGGKFGDYIKTSGYDGILIKGKSPNPVYLHINQEGLQVRDALHLWGEDTYHTHSMIEKEEPSKVSTMTIGPAGEKQVLLSSIVSDGRDARMAARCGVGAVMGSKNLKGVAIEKGNVKTPVFDEENLKESVKQAVALIVSRTEDMRLYGTASGVEGCYLLEDFPIKNWMQRKWDNIEALTGEHLANTLLTGRYACAKCPIRCGRKVQVKAGKYATPVEAGGPEYETMGSLGGSLMIDNLEAIVRANDLCNRYGMDTISVGQVLGFAFEAYEKGYLTEADTGCHPFEWGNAAAMVETVRAIGEKEGIGEILGQGLRRACRKITASSSHPEGDPNLNIQVKGLEFPSHDPRAFSSIALGYATSPRGACHLQAYSHGLEAWLSAPELGFNEVQDRFSPWRKPELTAKMQNLMSMFDSLKLCKFLFFGGLNISSIKDWLNYVTGWGGDIRDLLETGERIFTLKVLFNQKEGVSGKHNSLPIRFLKGTIGENFGGMLQDYYHFRGWSTDGVPSKKTLERLHILR
ncbi:MAG: aldehyde ferredoxin oxidoreductase family protein, partial [Spirochaetota bacterium]